MSPSDRMGWLRWWWPVILWAALITSFSTDPFSAAHTSRWILPFLRWLFPRAGLATLVHMHALIRKAAHIAEFFVFSLLALRGVRAARSGWRVEWGVAALALSAGWAGLDELHQAFVPSRGPSMLDVLIDACGAAVAQMVCAAATLFRSRPPGPGPEGSSS